MAKQIKRIGERVGKSKGNTRKRPSGIYYNNSFVSTAVKESILSWLSSIYPIREMRYSKNFPPPPNDEQRRLLRPVYWLGNWQFACLGYFHPPLGSQDRCVQAEPYPAVLKDLVSQAESIARHLYLPSDIPKGWHLNTCLVNFYGDQISDGKTIDTARVGDHKDFELGPVASISLGERAFFQFIQSSGRNQPSRIVHNMWLEDGSLQMFGGKRWKDDCFHRVQRVERKKNIKFDINSEGFCTRRINFTFRYVPTQFIKHLSHMPQKAKADITPYVAELAQHSSFFAAALNKSARLSAGQIKN